MRCALLLPLFALAAAPRSAALPADGPPALRRLPWEAAGLGERQAASHLLSRLTFGARPGEIDRVVAMGLESWLEVQLADLCTTVRELVYAPELWSAGARRVKIKSPFELAVSALRALGADLRDARPLARQVAEMGQPLYRYDAPAGFPDRAEQWVSSGALVERMSFGIDLAAGRVPGVRVDLARLVDWPLPQTTEAALEVLVPALLPDADLAEIFDQLGPLAGSLELPSRDRGGRRAAGPGDAPPTHWRSLDRWERSSLWATDRWRATVPPAVEQVAGVILGSPGFQRR